MTIKDALHNLAVDSGASDEYCHGLAIGVMATLMHFGDSYADAKDKIFKNLPEDIPKSRLPKGLQ